MLERRPQVHHPVRDAFCMCFGQGSIGMRPLAMCKTGTLAVSSEACFADSSAT